MTQQLQLPRPPVRSRPARRARGQAVGRPAPRDLSIPELLLELESPARRVSRAARDELAERPLVPRDQVWTILTRTTSAVTAGHCVALLARGERADSLTWLLNAVALGPDAVRAQACASISRWGDWRGPLPTERLQRLYVALCRAWPWLPTDLAEPLWASVEAAATAQRVWWMTRPGPPPAPPQLPRPAVLAPVVAPLMPPLMSPLPVTVTLTGPAEFGDYRWGRVTRRRFVLPPRWPNPLRRLFLVR